MDDTISREETKKTLKMLIPGLKWSAIDWMVDGIPSVQRWIPVSERLPDKGQMCLVCDKGEIGIDKYIGHGNPYNWNWCVRDYEAWMPLPAPYRPEGEEHERA